MPRGRPGGNPDISKYGFSQRYDWDESCTAKVYFRVPPSMKEALSSGELPGWQEFVRKAIAAELERLRAESA